MPLEYRGRFRGAQVYPKCLPEDRADEGMVPAVKVIFFMMRLADEVGCPREMTGS